MRSTTTAVLLAAAAACTLTVAGHTLLPKADASSSRIELSIATVDTVGLLEQMLQADDYAAAREATRASFEERMVELENENAELAAQLQTMDQSDPAFQEGVAKYQSNNSEMQQLGGQFGEQLDDLAASQAAEIYQAITEAVNTVAARENIEHVFSNRAAPDPESAFGIAGVTQQLLARPLIRTSATDLTEAVRNELGLPEPTQTEAIDPQAAINAALEAAAQGEQEETGEQPADEEPQDDSDG
ncbi:MAG: OmpH family outer membrane protein [Phycisphaerales bacterium JB040]